jgi:hypothetical protein
MYFQLDSGVSSAENARVIKTNRSTAAIEICVFIGFLVHEPSRAPGGIQRVE